MANYSDLIRLLFRCSSHAFHPYFVHKRINADFEDILVASKTCLINLVDPSVSSICALRRCFCRSVRHKVNRFVDSIPGCAEWWSGRSCRNTGNCGSLLWAFRIELVLVILVCKAFIPWNHNICLLSRIREWIWLHFHTHRLERGTSRREFESFGLVVLLKASVCLQLSRT